MSNFINHKYKLIIIHIPKCGGSSVRKYSGIRFTEKYMGYIPNKYINYNKIGFCRHPIERFLSAFKMFKFGTTVEPAKIKNLTIDTAINYLKDDSVKWNNSHSSIENFKHHAIPITHPYNCIEHADNIIKFEQYDLDVKRFLIDKGMPVKIKKTNSTQKININITKEQKNNLYDYYINDFERFNYEYI